MTGTTNKRRGLGRGLGALIVDTSSTPLTSATKSDQQSEIQTCILAKISPNPHQPRDIFDEEALQELATSIKAHGIIQPLVVTADPEQPDAYRIIAGERRWRAARLAGLEAVPVIVREASSQQLVEWALVENIQRADLNPLEEGAAYQTLVEEFGLTHGTVADRVGKSRSTITNTIRLLQAPASVQMAVTNKSISAGHARALLALEDDDIIESALQEVLSQTLNVRQTETLVKAWQARESRNDDPPADEEPLLALDNPEEAQITYMEDRFRTALGTRVNLNRQANGSGRLVIHFYNDEDLESIYRLIAGDDEHPIA